jgi:putative transcriptional regulator
MPKQKYNRIKTVLAEHDKSAKWLAEMLGKDKSTVSRWCTNDMQPAIETFYEIAKLLDIEVRELFIATKNRST